MNINTERCEAMVQAGVEDADSKEGIDFCVNSCPYPNGCILFDNLHSAAKTEGSTAFAKRLHSAGISTRDIALILKLSERTVGRYLRQ